MKSLLLEVTMTEALESDEKLLQPLDVAADHQPDEIDFCSEEVPREDHHVFLGEESLHEIDHVANQFLELIQVDQDG